MRVDRLPVVVRGAEEALGALCEQETVSYRDLTLTANRFGNLLRTLACSPRERVVIALPDCCEFLYAFLGSIKSGAWPVAVNAGLTREEYEFIVRDCQASLLVTSAESAASQLGSDGVAQTLLLDRSAGRGWLDASSPELDPHPSREDDIAFLLYSSGSTGKPKGVPHRHGGMPFSAETFGRQVLGVSSDDLVFSASKLPFAYGLGNSISFPFSAGASVVLYPGRCTPDQVLRLITTSIRGPRPDS